MFPFLSDLPVLKERFFINHTVPIDGEIAHQLYFSHFFSHPHFFFFYFIKGNKTHFNKSLNIQVAKLTLVIYMFQCHSLKSPHPLLLPLNPKDCPLPLCLLCCRWRDTRMPCQSHLVVSDSLWPHGLYSPWSSPGQNTRVGSRSLLQGIFPTQGSNPGLPRSRQILYQLSHQGSPYMPMADSYWCMAKTITVL